MPELTRTERHVTIDHDTGTIEVATTYAMGDGVVSCGCCCGECEDITLTISAVSDVTVDPFGLAFDLDCNGNLVPRR